MRSPVSKVLAVVAFLQRCFIAYPQQCVQVLPCSTGSSGHYSATLCCSDAAAIEDLIGAPSGPFDSSKVPFLCFAWLSTCSQPGSNFAWLSSQFVLLIKCDAVRPSLITIILGLTNQTLQ